MGWLDEIGNAWDSLGSFVGDVGEFATDARSIYSAVQGVRDGRTSLGPMPGIVSLPPGAGATGTGRASASFDAGGLVILGLAGVAAYFLLRRS